MGDDSHGPGNVSGVGSRRRDFRRSFWLQWRWFIALDLAALAFWLVMETTR